MILSLSVALKAHILSTTIVLGTMLLLICPDILPLPVADHHGASITA